MEYPKANISKMRRVELTEQIRSRFVSDIFKDTVPRFSKNKGLSYSLVYNLVHGRVKSLSIKDYRIIFSEEPPTQEPRKVDGEYFREMVKVWLFLNDYKKKSDFYSELYGGRPPKRIDHRILSGQTKSIDASLETAMENKFLDNGLDRSTIKQWLQEFREEKVYDKVPYETIKPVLLYLKNALHLNPTRILHQWFERYESGQLKSVSKQVYLSSLALKERAVTAVNSGHKFEVDKLREEICGPKDGFTLYSSVAEELKFLRNYAGKKPKAYLGRGIGMYEKGQIKRIASWRASKIIADCNAFIGRRQDLSFLSLPKSYQKKWADTLLSALRSCLTARLFQNEGITFENKILKPSHANDAYKKQVLGLIRFDMATSTLGMTRRAFDLMVAKHCDIFRGIGTYTDKWYLPNQYLEELRKRDFFDIVVAKYELMAKKMYGSQPVSACMN